MNAYLPVGTEYNDATQLNVDKTRNTPMTIFVVEKRLGVRSSVMAPTINRMLNQPPTRKVWAIGRGGKLVAETEASFSPLMSSTRSFNENPRAG